MKDLKQKITEVFISIPKEPVRKAAINMKTSDEKLVIEESKGFEGMKIRI